MHPIIHSFRLLLRLGLLFTALVFSPCFGQPYDADQLRKESQKRWPDEQLEALQAHRTLTFQKSAGTALAVTEKAQLTYLGLRTRTAPTVSIAGNTHTTVKDIVLEHYNSTSRQFAKMPVFPKKSPLESNGIFHDDAWMVAVRPGANENSVLRLSYTRITSDYKFMPTMHFLPGMPARESRIVVEIPSWLELDIIERNFTGWEVGVSRDLRKDGTTVATYHWRDIPAYKAGVFSPSSRHYLPHLVFVYKGIQGGPELMPTTAHLYAWYKQLVDQVQEKPGTFKELAAQFTHMAPDLEQIYAVSNWVRDNIRYIAFEDGINGFRPQACQQVFEQRYGDCKGMANLCKHLLRELGYDARLAWIGTRGDVPYDYSIPSIAVDNHIIAVVQHQGNWIFLDPTETYGNAGTYAYRIQGRQAMIEDGASHLLVYVPASDAGTDLLERNITVSFDGHASKLGYTVKSKYRGEPRKRVQARFHGSLTANKDEALIAFLKPDNSSTFSLLSANGMDGAEEIVDLHYEFTSTDGLIVADNEYYIKLDPTGDLTQVTQHKNRIAPWQFGEVYHRHTGITFAPPAGFEIKHIPYGFSAQGEGFAIDVEVKKEGRNVQVKKKILIHSGEIDHAHTEAWHQALERLQEYYEDHIILSRK